MPAIGYLNRQFLPLEKIVISPDDRGFLFGDGIYELIRAYHSVPAFWEEHYSRLVRSAGEVRIPFPCERQDFHSLLLTGLQKCDYAEGKIYIQLTRGVAPREHGFPLDSEPTFFLSFREMATLPDELTHQGVKVITVPDIRWDRCDIKSLNLLPNVLAKQRAQEEQCFESIFVRNGWVKEGATSNIFVVKDGKISTPERDHFALAGVTQQQVINLAHQQGRTVEFGKVSLESLFDADEVFLTGTTIEVLPVVNIDGQGIKDETPGPITCSLQEQFFALVSQLSSRP